MFSGVLSKSAKLKYELSDKKYLYKGKEYLVDITGYAEGVVYIDYDNGYEFASGIEEAEELEITDFNIFDISTDEEADEDTAENILNEITENVDYSDYEIEEVY